MRIDAQIAAEVDLAWSSVQVTGDVVMPVGTETTECGMILDAIVSLAWVAAGSCPLVRADTLDATASFSNPLTRIASMWSGTPTSNVSRQRGCG